MLRDSAHEKRYLVLNIAKGLRFGHLNNFVLRVFTLFQNKRVASNYLLATPEPNFDIHFVWCTTSRHLNLLQKWCSNIEIAICATNAGQTWTAGCTMIGIQHAQLFEPNFKLSTRHLPLYDVKKETRIDLQPELSVTLSIRSEPPINIGSQLHSTNLPESSRPVISVDGIVRRRRSSTGSAATTTKKGQKEESQKSSHLLSQPHSYQKQKNQTGSPKTKDRRSVPKYKILPPYERLVTNMQPSLQMRTPPLPPERTFDESLSNIDLQQDQEMYKDVRESQETKDVCEPQETKDCKDDNVPMPCCSTQAEQEVPESHDCSPILPNNMRIPSRIRLILMDIDRSKMASLGIYGSSSDFQMISQLPPTSIPEVPIRKLHDPIPAPQEAMSILKIRKATSSILMETKTTEAEEEEIEIQKPQDQTPAPPACAPLQTVLTKPHAKVKKSVRFKEGSASVMFKEDTDEKQC